jgi:hypothetical protein
MYILIAKNHLGVVEYYGPFPTVNRACEYGDAFEGKTILEISPMVVPNAITVKVNY